MKTALIVLKKELKGIFKHSSTFIMSIILPLLYFPILLTLFIRFSNSTESSLKTPNIAFFVKNEKLENIYDENNQDLKDFKMIIGDDFKDAKYLKTDDYLSDLEELKVDVFVSFNKTLQNDENKYHIEMIYSSNNELGASYISLLSSRISTYSLAVIDTKLAYLDTSLSKLSTVDVTYEEIKDKFKNKKYEGFNDSLLGQLLPTFLTLFLSFGSLAVTSQIFIMEKEKKTIEPLLATSCKRRDILTGKILTSYLFSFISFVGQFIGLFIAVLINLDYFKNTNIYFSASTVCYIIFSLLSVTLLTTTLSIYSLINSKSVKAANSKQSLLQLIPSILSLALMFLKLRTLNNKAYAFIPIFNTFSAFKLASYGIVNSNIFFSSICINIAIVCILLELSYKKYKSESILY